MNKRGFTLVELLVVITVIAILAAILLPAVSSGITTAKLTKCRSNLRSILQASAAYGGEQGLEELMPRFYGTTVDAPHEGRNRTTDYKPMYPGNPVIAIHLRNNFIKDYRTFRCPLVNIDWETYFNPEPNQVQTSFWGTYIWWFQHVPAAEERPQRNGNGSTITAVADEARTLAISDIKPGYWTDNGTGTANFEHYNAGFGDGSVRLLGKKGYNLSDFAY